MTELDDLGESLRRIENRLSDDDRKQIQDTFGHIRDAFTLLETKYLDAIRDRAIVHSLLKRTSEDLIQRYRAIFEYSGTAMVVLEQDGIISLANSYFETMVGHSRSEIEGFYKFSEFTDPLLKDLVERAMLPGGDRDPAAQHYGEGQITDIHGKRFSVVVRIGKFPDTGQCVVSIMDITERKRAEEELRESREYLGQIFSSVKSGIAIIDAKTHVILDVNPAAAQMIGLEKDEIAGRVCHQYICPAERCRCPITDLNQSVDNSERILINKDGVKVPIIKHVARLTIHARDCLLETFIDNTERKRAEEELRQANRKLNLLSGITRHDIKNQLMMLLSYLELSRNSLADPTKTAEFIEKEKRIAGVIATQISFTKEYEDLGVRAPVWQNVDAVIKRMIAGLLLRDVRIEIRDLDLEVFADPLLEKVFYNLIDNALRYGGGNMTTIRCYSLKSEIGLVIIIEDDGEGISVEDKARLFERGFGKNTGLGLFLSREILSIKGMTIAETGEPGKGARFEIAVPEGQHRFVEGR